MADTIMTYGDISPRTAAFVVVELLKRGMPYMCLEKFGQAKALPSNKTQSMKFRRYEHLPIATTPLTEGVTPTSIKLSFTDITAVLRQYGSIVEITDIVADTHEDPILKEATIILGEQAARTVETIRWNVLKAGTNVFYTNGTARTSVNTPISLAKQRAITRALKAQNAVKITSVIKSTSSFNTESVLPSFIAVAHTDIENDLRNMPGFIDVKDYGTITPFESEIGAVEDCRYLVSTVFTSWVGSATAGGAYAGSGTAMVSADASHADVYPILYFARDAYGTVALKGQNSITPTVINPTPTKSDPLGQRGSVGWKTMQTAVILNDAWMARLECAVTAL
jgi:N4-gp56 family major capsid protein